MNRVGPVGTKAPVERAEAPVVSIDIPTPSGRSTMGELEIELGTDGPAVFRFLCRQVGEVSRSKLARWFTLPEGELVAGDVKFRAFRRMGLWRFQVVLGCAHPAYVPRAVAQRLAQL